MKVRWVTPLGVDTASTSYCSSSASRPSHSRTPRPSRIGTCPDFAQDFQSVRKFADRDHANIVSWNRYPSGSHFATRDASDLLISNIRSFYRPLR